MKTLSRLIRWTLGLLIGAVALLPIVVFAATNVPGPTSTGPGQSVWTLYTIGAGPALYGLLNSIQVMVTQQGYQDLLLFVAVVGFLVNATSSMIRGQAHRIAGSVLLIAFVSYMAYDITIDVQIDDQASNYVNVVQNVPAIVGLPAVMISEIGYFLEQETEQDFTLPGFSALELSNGGLFNMSAAVVNALNTPVINDIPLRSTFNDYFNDCVVPAIANHTILPQDIGLASPGSTTYPPLITALGAADSQALLTRDYLATPSPSNVTCYTAYNDIKTAINNDYPNILTQTMGQAYQVYGASGAAATLYSSAITNGFNWLTNNTGSPSAQSLVIQSAMMDLTRGGFAYSAAQTGGSPIVNSVNLQEAYRQQQSSWWAASQLFAKIGPMFYVVLYAFVVGLAPFIIIGMFIPRLGGMMAMSYFQILVWLALWQPAFSILNYIMALFEQNSSTEVMTNMGTWSIESHTVLNQAANNYILVAGFLATLTPMILFSLVKSGSMAFTGFLEAASSKSAAVQAGNSMASGNLSLGQESIDNTSMNKYDITRSAAFGSSGVVANEGFGADVVKQDFSGAMAMEGNVGLGGVTRTTQTTAGNREESSLSAQSLTSDYSRINGGLALMSQALHNWRDGTTGRQTADGVLQYGQSASDQQEYRRLRQLAHTAEATTQASTGSSNSVQTGISAHAGISAGGSGGSGPSAGVGANVGAQSTDTASQGHGDGLKTSTNTHVGAGHTTATQQRAEKLGRASEAYAKAVEAFHQYGLISDNQYQDMMGQVKQYDRTARAGETDTFGVSATTTTTSHTPDDAAEYKQADAFSKKDLNRLASEQSRLAAYSTGNGYLETDVPGALQGDRQSASHMNLPANIQRDEAIMQHDAGQSLTPSESAAELKAMAEVGRYQGFMNDQKAILGNGDRDVDFVGNNNVANTIGNKDLKAGDATGLFGHVENMFEGIPHPGTSEGLDGQTGNPRTLSTPFGEIAKLNMSDPGMEGQFSSHPIPGMQVVGIFQPKGSSDWQALYQREGSNTALGGARTYYTVGNDGAMTSISERSVKEPTGTQRQFFVQTLSAQENWGSETSMVRNATNGMAEASGSITPTYSSQRYTLSKDGTVFAAGSN
ncbi:hypothetical protein BJI67_16130 (plasmid) [Acidihalobacter aeolianus]|uniref:TraG N-terminal Proteobacteria domain-containing protein n=1 Tax=Acidihalobacter aeolianus TaxID=2792603 RepID=A0A1D8KCT0_9GAMM|nr:conjugal transfer protein TraG N-terminal domain-containing protein [Acidihalobacter aeolianus]AOV18767.1 hypothetical protein BJI67_16130 [Acidihalobacter aeolianus]